MFNGESTDSFRQLGALREDYESEARNTTFEPIQSKIDESAKFDVLIETIQTNFSEVQLVMQDMLRLKDELLLHFLPPPLLFKLAVVFGKVFRVFSDLNTPVSEMLRLVKIYSASWEKNSAILKKIHDMYENKKQMLNIAIKRLALVDKKAKLFNRERRILNWEKLYIKLNETKGHGRRWKFQMETFRKKTNQGYDELVKWVMREPTMNFDEQELRKTPKPDKSKNDKENIDNLSMEITKSNFSDDPMKKMNDENYMVEVDSDQDLFSDSGSERGGQKNKNKEQAKNLTEANTQTEPDLESIGVWTGEPDYKRFFIVRVFRPAEFNNKKIKLKVSFGDASYTSKAFDNIKKVVIVENKSEKNNKNKTKKENKENENETKDEKKVDVNRYEDFLFEINDFFVKKEVLSTSTENSVSFELKIDDKEEPIGFSLIQLDDIHTLDLPILYYKPDDQEKIIDHYLTTEEPITETENSKNWLNIFEFNSESADRYEILSKRTPFLFEMYKSKTLKTSTDSVCKLPLMFFWVRKPLVLNKHKNTGTESIKDIVLDLTGFDISQKSRKDIEEMMQDKDLISAACSPIQFRPPTPKRPPSSPQETPKSSQEDSIKNQNSQDVNEIHENYQLKIDELNLIIYRLENEIQQLKSLNELKQDTKPSFVSTKHKNSLTKSINEYRKQSQISKSEDQYTRNKSTMSSETQNLKPIPSYFNKNSIWSKNIPDGFYERLRIFNEKSYLHQKEIIEKYVSQEAAIIEQQMAVQHRLDTNTDQNQNLDDFCLPAVFMPFKNSNNVYNPRARQYFHPSGSTDVRLTQPPTVFQLPPLPAKPSLSVINLFDLGKRYEAGEPDYYINEIIKQTANKLNESKTKQEEEVEEEENDELKLDNFQNKNSISINQNDN